MTNKLQRQLACWSCCLGETYGYDGNQSGIIIAKIGSGEKMDVASENGVIFPDSSMIVKE